MNPYNELMRDLAHDEPNHGYSKANLTLTTAQAAIVLRQYPDLFAEAMAGGEGTIAGLMEAMERTNRFDLICAGIAAEVANRVREKAADWIMSDVQDACDEASRVRRLEHA